jgi:hypothetical protein
LTGVLELQQVSLLNEYKYSMRDFDQVVASVMSHLKNGMNMAKNNISSATEKIIEDLLKTVEVLEALQAIKTKMILGQAKGAKRQKGHLLIGGKSLLDIVFVSSN